MTYGSGHADRDEHGIGVRWTIAPASRPRLPWSLLVCTSPNRTRASYMSPWAIRRPISRFIFNHAYYGHTYTYTAPIARPAATGQWQQRRIGRIYRTNERWSVAGGRLESPINPRWIIPPLIASIARRALCHNNVVCANQTGVVITLSHSFVSSRKPKPRLSHGFFPSCRVAVYQTTILRLCAIETQRQTRWCARWRIYIEQYSVYYRSSSRVTHRRTLYAVSSDACFCASKIQYENTPHDTPRLRHVLLARGAVTSRMHCADVALQRYTGCSTSTAFCFL